MGYEVLPKGQIKKLRDLSRYVAEVANLGHWLHQPFVGGAAFAHKGGMHVSAIRRHPGTYEHITPETVGNHRRVLISDLSGRSNILSKFQEKGIEFKTGDPATEGILESIKDLEHKGYQFEAAEASFEILVRRAMGTHEPFFELKGFRVIDEKRSEGEAPVAEATIMVEVDGTVEHTAALGNGPVNAMDNAIRKALEKFYPQLSEVELLDYNVITPYSIHYTKLYEHRAEGFCRARTRPAKHRTDPFPSGNRGVQYRPQHNRQGGIRGAWAGGSYNFV